MKLEAKALCFSYDMSGMNEIGFPGNESKRTKRNRTTREILSRFDLTLESGELVGAAAPSGFAGGIFETVRRRDSSGWKAACFVSRILSGADDLAAAGAGSGSENADAEYDRGGR